MQSNDAVDMAASAQSTGNTRQMHCPSGSAESAILDWRRTAVRQSMSLPAQQFAEIHHS